MKLDQLLQSFEIFLGFLHVVLAEVLVQIGNQAADFVTDEGKVERFKLTQDFVAEDEVETVDFGTAATNIGRDEVFQLLNDTVTECKTEMFDNIVVEFRKLAKAFFGNLVFNFALSEHILKVLIRKSEVSVK